MTRRSEAGFTLVELLVALAVFSLAVMALLNVAGENTRAAVSLEERALAGVVAENRAVEALTAEQPPSLGVASGVEAAGERTWRWARQVSRTEDPMVLRVDIAVTAEGGGATLADVTLFRVVR